MKILQCVYSKNSYYNIWGGKTTTTTNKTKGCELVCLSNILITIVYTGKQLFIFQQPFLLFCSDIVLEKKKRPFANSHLDQE